MIPANILTALIMFTIVYLVGLLFSISFVIISIMDRNKPLIIVSMILVLTYLSFGLALI